MAENVGAIVWTAEMQTEQLVSAEKQISNSLAKTESSFIAAGKSAQTMNTQVSKAASGVTQSLGGLGRSAGQAGIQIQQFVGQLQGGVSPMVALSQQSADLGFTLGVPLLGAVVSIAAAIGGLLVNSINKAKGAASDLPDEIKQRLEVIKQQFSEVEETSRTAFSQVQLGKINTEVDTANKRLAELKERLAFLESGRAPPSLIGESNLQLIAKAKKAIDEQAVTVSNLNKLYAGAVQISQESIDVSKQASNEAIKDTATLAQQIEVMTERVANGDAAARRMAIAFQLGLTNAEMLPAEIDQALTALEKTEAASKRNAEALKRSSEEAANQKRELESAKNSWEKLSESIARQSATAQGAAAANQYQIEQIQLAGQAAGKTAEEIQKLVDAQNALFAAQEKNKADKVEDKQVSKVEEMMKEIELQQIRNSLGNDEYELKSAINALGKDATPEEVTAITNQITQLQALRFEYELLGATIQESMQGVALNAMDNFSAGLARVITEGDSAREMFGNLAKTIATELLTAIIRYWVGQAAAALVGQTAVTAATVTAGGAAAAAWAPAATLASIATLGGAATVGVAALGTGLTAGVGLAAATQTGSALAAGAGRKNGGPVNAGMIYPVSEGGDPELLMQGGRSYLLPGAGGGNVVSAKDMQVSGGGGNAPIINITNYSGGQASVQSQRFSEQDKRWVLDVVVGDMNKRGATHKAVTGTTNAVNRTS